MPAAAGRGRRAAARPSHWKFNMMSLTQQGSLRLVTGCQARARARLAESGAGPRPAPAPAARASEVLGASGRVCGARRDSERPSPSQTFCHCHCHSQCAGRRQASRRPPQRPGWLPAQTVLSKAAAAALAPTAAVYLQTKSPQC